jgi:hypothetical protein
MVRSTPKSAKCLLKATSRDAVMQGRHSAIGARRAFATHPNRTQTNLLCGEESQYGDQKRAAYDKRPYDLGHPVILLLKQWTLQYCPTIAAKT